MGEVIEGDFIQAADSFDYANAMSKKGKIRIHVKVDTGMSRLGIYCHNDDDIIKAADEIEAISKLENISIEGIFTHFADSDGIDSQFTERQFSVFKKLLCELENRKVKVGLRHCCNSAATLRYDEMHLDMVRAGIILYGLMPSKNVSDENIKLAMKLTARVSAIHELKKGDCVSYGCTYKAENDTKVAVISIGYADGFSRVYSGKELIRINGKTFKTVGKICMDMCIVDVGKDFEIDIADEAVIFESAEDIDKLAETLGTINYEILCSLKNRVQLEYSE
jgi:alanine racemase